MADLGALHEFPQCPAGSELSKLLGEWLVFVNEPGQDLPPRHLTTLVLKMLPAEVYDDVKGGCLDRNRVIEARRFEIQ